MTELSAADKWLYTVLSGDAQLVGLINGRVFDTLAPESAAFPYVVFQYQGGHDVRGNGPTRVMTNSLYLVKAVGRGGSYASLWPIANRLDELLHAQHGANADGQAWAVREQPFKLLEVDNGVQYRHLGGLYRIYVMEA
jgi:hypothetical protein